VVGPQAAARPRETAKRRESTGSDGNPALAVCAGQSTLLQLRRGWWWRAGLYAGFCEGPSWTHEIRPVTASDQHFRYRTRPVISGPFPMS
jgi:hypothetical protein